VVGLVTDSQLEHCTFTINKVVKNEKIKIESPNLQQTLT
jgi:hypothetical protein